MPWRASDEALAHRIPGAFAPADTQPIGIRRPEAGCQGLGQEAPEPLPAPEPAGEMGAGMKFISGRAIRELWLPGEGNADNSSYRVGANGVLSIALQVTDGGEMWAHVELGSSEVSINLRQVTTIIWGRA